MIASRNLEDLLPQVEALANLLVKRCEAELEIDELRITSTHRDFEYQNSLYAQGRTAPGGIVTNARAGSSWHNWKRAFDVVPMIGKQCVWNDAKLWQKIGKIGVEIGLEWAGNWRSFKEFPHFQLTEGHSLAEMLAKHPKGLR